MNVSQLLRNTAFLFTLILSPNVLAAQFCPEKLLTNPLAWYRATLLQVTDCLELGMDPNAIIHGDRSAFLLAVSRSNNTQIIQALIDAGADVNSSMDHGYGALIMAKSPELIRMLVEAGADLEAPYHDGRTPLLNAVGSYVNGTDDERQEKFDIIRLLVELGADIYAQDNNGYTVLHWAVNAGHGRGADYTEVIKFLGECPIFCV